MSLALRLGRRALIGGVILAMLAFAPFALATKKYSNTNDVLKLRGGATEVSLDAGAAGALQSLGVSVAPTGKAYATKSGAIRFPITRGEVDAETLAGQIRHAGGLKFSAGKTSVMLDRYHINIDGSPDLSARVNLMGPDRIELFDLDVSGLKVTSEKGKTVISGVKLTLTDTAAGALNATFGVEAFGEGLAIGDATVKSYARASTVRVPDKLRLFRGWTTVALDPATAGVLTDNGVAVAPVGTAKAGVSGVSFPITWGKVATDTLAGRIAHRGGLSLTAGDTTVTLRRFVIDTTSGKLSGVVFVGDQRVGRIPLFTIDAGNVQTVLVKRFLRATDVQLSLTGQAAAALNDTFKVNLFAEGLAIGTAKVRARTGHYGWWYRAYRHRHR
jgi:hypothetical protein